MVSPVAQMEHRECDKRGSDSTTDIGADFVATTDGGSNVMTAVGWIAAVVVLLSIFVAFRLGADALTAAWIATDFLLPFCAVVEQMDPPPSVA